MAGQVQDIGRTRAEVIGVETALQAQSAALAEHLHRRAPPVERAGVSLALSQLGGQVAQLDLALRHLGAALHGAHAAPDHRDGLLVWRSGEERRRLWPRLRRLVDHVGGKRRKPRQSLFQRLAPDHPLAVRERLMETLYEGLHRHMRPPDPRGLAKLGYHPDIPLPLSALLPLLQAARRITLAQGRAGPLSFLDVGSGLGTVMLAALPLFHSVTGLELGAASLRAARSLLAGEPAARLLQGDALAFEGYDRFDVIHYFQPIRDEALMRRLEARVARLARPGTLILAPGALTVGAGEGSGMVPVDGAIHIAGTSRGAAQRLRVAAEWIGTALPQLVPDADAARLGWMFPLVARCRQMGFDLDRPQARWPARRD
ncbi:class I SAM-dependent methyltransferase [Frigidibacter sp. ROC022]|uniref:class I SAM-dependent methyltransferase n=1 Tax=Frigidibacter sp. ROC022 TaxID=2971796 RepID=UPI00215B5EF0|nr:class I SAM-dependent methyltransferase [Frigidibacter sp. ROC022]MCR8724327.1 class I SAM-dependent methyltransferase [Frigidibacter sp. ROC022]